MTAMEKLAIVAIIGVAGLIVCGCVYAVVRRIPVDLEAERAEQARERQREAGTR